MWISLRFMMLEMSVLTQPLRQLFSQYAGWVTHSWLKSLWEKCDEYNITIKFNGVPLKFPRARDNWLTWMFAVWACKQVNNIAGTNANIEWFKK